MRHEYDLKAAIDALTLPRILHTTQPHERTGELQVRSIEHPALISLLESGTGSSRAGGGTRSSGSPSPIDSGALETWAQIRDQVRAWLGQLRAPWSDDLKTDLRTWHGHHELAVARARTTLEADVEVGRIVQAWVERIEQKYDPDVVLEWTEACPAVIGTLDRWGATTGHSRRCGARRIEVEKHQHLALGAKERVMQFAITVNLTHQEAECRACGTRWEGERQLMQLRYESNLWELERALEAAPEPQAPGGRELALTGPIDLP